jgi:hypothetical protein
MNASSSEVLFSISIISGLASAALVFGLTAMAWQTFKDRSFLLLALSSMLFLLITFVDELMANHTVSDSDYDAYWYCRQIASIIGNILYPWAMIELFRFIRARFSPSDLESKLDEQKSS